MSDFRIAHVSDLHLTTRSKGRNPVEDSTDIWDAVCRASAHLFSSQKNPNRGSLFYPSGCNPDAALRVLHEFWADEHLNAVLITGDLATTGRNEDLFLAANYLRGQIPMEWHGDAGAVPSLLSGLPVIAMPGNHDRYGGRLGLPRSVEFERQFGDYWDLGQELLCSTRLLNAESRRVRYVPFQRNNKLLVIVLGDMSLDSAHDAYGGGEWSYFGQGRVYPNVLEEMIECSENAYAEAEERGWDIGVLWAVHFAPNFPNVKQELALLESESLVEAAAKHNVPVILCGHTHQALWYSSETVGGSVEVICSGPTAGFSEEGDYSYTLLEIMIPAAKQIRVVPKHLKWVDGVFEEQPALSCSSIP